MSPNSPQNLPPELLAIIGELVGEVRALRAERQVERISDLLSKPWLSVGEAARVLDTSEAGIRQQVRRGHLVAFMVAGRRMIDTQALLKVYSPPPSPPLAAGGWMEAAARSMSR